MWCIFYLLKTHNSIRYNYLQYSISYYNAFSITLKEMYQIKMGGKKKHMKKRWIVKRTFPRGLASIICKQISVKNIKSKVQRILWLYKVKDHLGGLSEESSSYLGRQNKLWSSEEIRNAHVEGDSENDFYNVTVLISA